MMETVLLEHNKNVKRHYLEIWKRVFSDTMHMALPSIEKDPAYAAHAN